MLRCCDAATLLRIISCAKISIAKTRENHVISVSNNFHFSVLFVLLSHDFCLGLLVIWHLQVVQILVESLIGINFSTTLIFDLKLGSEHYATVVILSGPNSCGKIFSFSFYIFVDLTFTIYQNSSEI